MGINVLTIMKLNDITNVLCKLLLFSNINLDILNMESSEGDLSIFMYELTGI